MPWARAGGRRRCVWPMLRLLGGVGEVSWRVLVGKNMRLKKGGGEGNRELLDVENECRVSRRRAEYWVGSP